MTEVLSALAWIVVGSLLGALGVGFARRWRPSKQELIVELLRTHFSPLPIQDITVSERRFPFRVRADLQRAANQLLGGRVRVLKFCGVHSPMEFFGVSLSSCLVSTDPNVSTLAVPPKYEAIDVGEDEPIQVSVNGLWLLESDGVRYAALLTPCAQCRSNPGIEFQVAVPNTAAGARIAQGLFDQLEAAIRRAESYRGKILSLEQSAHSYSGESTGIKVHKLRLVERDQVILPELTLQLLERNVIRFVKQRAQLTKLGQATKKGLLFYGPPGTGKTHTIHYLAHALEGHTTLLISAEQVVLLEEYMTLARLLQPSIVVLEDVDLIARDRGSLNSPCEELLLNKLLNEMDGLKESADILFILTTNRPETLEAALASRPGRIDQAVEFPLPDEAGRRKLVELYGAGLPLTPELNQRIVGRTDRVSAAFIKELMRRTAQFHLERNGDGPLTDDDVDLALNEMLFSGGVLNVKLLGGQAPSGGDAPPRCP